MRIASIAGLVGLISLAGFGVSAYALTRPAALSDHVAPQIDAARVALSGWRRGPHGPALILPAPDGGVDMFERDGAEWVRVRTPPDDLSEWPADADAPYAVRAVETRSADGTRIAATYFQPPRARTGIVIIHGSGDSDRRNRWYIDIADALARRGIAVWFPDKRGTGATPGRWRDASFDLLAQDAVAGQKALAGLMAVPPATSIGYLGISQGGWIAPLAAQKAPAPFVVALSAAAVTPNEQLRHEVRANLVRDYPDFVVSLAIPIASNMPRWRYPAFWKANGAIDPIEAMAKSRTPTIVILGDRDEYDNVPVARSVALYRAAAGRGVPVEVRVVRGGGHDLSPGEGVGPMDRAALGQVEAFIKRASGRAGTAGPRR